MPIYEYIALDEKGKNKKGIIDADNAGIARQKLRELNVYPVEINESNSLPKTQGYSYTISSLFSRITPGNISSFTRQLSILLESGITLIASLETLIAQSDNPPFKKMLAQIKEAVNEGNSFASVLSNYPRQFSQVYINMIRAGETSGTLGLVLGQLAEFSENQEALKNRIRAALVYPIFMAIVGTLVLFLLITFIVPDIIKIFSDLEQVLPLPTIILIHVSNFLQSFWWIIMLVIGVALFLGKQFKKTPKGRHLWDKFKIQMPLMGSIHIKLATARFGRTLSSLLQGSVPLLSSLQIVRNIVNNTLIANTLDTAIDEIEKGKSLAAPLERSQWIPPIAIQMIKVGEQTGKLETMLDKIADIYEREAETKILAMTSLLEPVMILVMASLVGFIAVAILFPIFEMSQMIR